jgi:cholesterol transport system auxiliary component
MRFKHAAVLGVAVIVSACSIGRPLPSVSTYSIEPPLAAPNLPKSPHPQRLRVERVRVAAPYDRTALIYRLSPVRYISDPYHAFLADPGPMLSNRIVEWLGAEGQFKEVDGPGGAAPASWVLEATVTELYGDFEAGDNNPAAVMSIRFTIIDESAAHAKVAYQRSLSQRVTVASASPEALVVGYGKALADMLDQFTTDLSNSPLQ